MTDPLLDKSSAQRKTFFSQNHALLKQLTHEGQTPTALLICCADSRVMPEALFGLQPGQFFILRTVGNLIPPYHAADAGTVSALEFAILQLQVPHLIICGHTDCGAIHGLDTPIDVSQKPALSRWLELARPAQRDVDFLGKVSGTERHRAIVEQNVRQQLAHVQSYPYVQAAMRAGKLSLHGWVYYLEIPAVGYLNQETGEFVV